MPTPAQAAAVEVFTSYAHEDEALRDELESDMAMLAEVEAELNGS